MLRLETIILIFFKGNKKASKLYSIIGPFLIESSREPSGVSTINTVPGSQWSLWIIPMATFVLKSGDQAAEVTFPTKMLFLRNLSLLYKLCMRGICACPSKQKIYKTMFQRHTICVNLHLVTDTNTIVRCG